MSVVETIYPDGDVSSGSWKNQSGGTLLYTALDEVGAHNGDTDYAQLKNVVTGTLASTFEVTLANPASAWKGIPGLRDGETWKAIKTHQVRDTETWKTVKSLSVRDGESWKLLVPLVTIRVTAKRINNLMAEEITGSFALKAGAATIASQSLTLTDGVYVETSLEVSAGDLMQYDPTDLRVAVSGSVTTTDILANGPSTLRVTQIKVELND